MSVSALPASRSRSLLDYGVALFQSWSDGARFIGAMLLSCVPLFGPLFALGWMARAVKHLADGGEGLPAFDPLDLLLAIIRTWVGQVSTMMMLMVPWAFLAAANAFSLVMVNVLEAPLEQLVLAVAPEVIAAAVSARVELLLGLVRGVAMAVVVLPLAMMQVEAIRLSARGAWFPVAEASKWWMTVCAQPAAFLSYALVVLAVGLFPTFPAVVVLVEPSLGLPIALALMVVLVPLGMMVLVAAMAKWDVVAQRALADATLR